MKRSIILIIVTLFCVLAFGQDEKYLNIYKSFRNLPNDKLIEVAESYFDKNVLDSALVCFTIVYNDYDSSRSKQDKKLYAQAYNRAGNIHYIMYNYVRAQDMYLRSLEICEECGYNEYLPRIYNNLGNIYASFGDYNKAKSFYEKALPLSISSGDTATTSVVLDNLIGTCSNLRDDQLTYRYIEMSDSINGSKGVSLVGITARGMVALDNGDYNMAFKYTKKACRLADSLKMPPKFKCVSLNNLASVFSNTQRFDSAMYYLFESEKIAKKNRLLDMQSYIYFELASIGNRIKDKKIYSHYNELHRAIEDSVLGNKGYRSIKDVEFLFEMNRLDKQMAAMKTEQLVKDAQLSHQKMVIIVVSSILLLIAVFSFITYKQKRKLQISYKDIFNKNIEIIASEKQAKQRYLEYERLLREKDEYISKMEYNKPSVAEEQEQPGAGNAGKYQNSPLNEKQREALINSINHVMENTLEFCNAEFTLEKLAELVDSKTKYVSQVINETYGKNFNRYINEYRIKEARRRLTDTDEYGQYTLRAISQSVGFKSSSNFNLLFKELTGITPSMYQNLILNVEHNN